MKRLDQMGIQGFGPMLGRLLQELAPEAEVRTRRLIEAMHALSTAPDLRDQFFFLWVLH